jgi:hypothetical protein
LKGEKGEKGTDGTMTFEDLTDEQKATLKGEKGDPFTYEDFTPEQLSALKGEKGDKGDSIKGDKGNPGSNGVSATHSWNGTTLTITSASGTSSADLKGDKGDTGEVDYSRLNEYLPLSGGTMTGPIKIGQDNGKGIELGNAGRIMLGSNCVVGVLNGEILLGSSAHPCRIRGNASRPTYNGKDMALQSDIPSVPTLNTEPLTFHYEDGTQRTIEVYVK